MLRLRKALEEKLKKSAAVASSSNSNPKILCEDVDRPCDTMEANEDVKPCKICKKPVSTKHECNSQAKMRWLANKNARSRRIRNMKRRTKKPHVVSRKSRFARRPGHHGNRNTTIRKRAMHQRFTCTKPRGRGMQMSSEETKHKYASLKSSRPTVHIRRGIRKIIIHKQVARKQPTSTKQSIQSNQNTSPRPIKKHFARRSVSSLPNRRRSSSHKSQVRAGHRMLATKRSERLGASKMHSSRKITPTIEHLPRRNRSCPPRQ
ncbi:hypothetical protein CBL_14490 [Carabus blaptoides fortunei]